MSETLTAASPPPGFSRHYKQSPLTNPWEPLYSRKGDGVVAMGFWAGEAHANSRGFVHGGMLTALSDNAMGLSCGETLGAAASGRSLLTVSLAVDFLGTAQQGQWVQINPTVNRAGSTLCFAEALITADGAPCAKAHAMFRVVARNPPP